MPRYPTLLKKMTPAAHVRSTGSHNRAPTITSDPRGSFTTADRKLSYWERKRSCRSAKGPVPRSGPPLTTNRVGSPPVWESMTRIRWPSFTVIHLVFRPPGKNAHWYHLNYADLPELSSEAVVAT